MEFTPADFPPRHVCDAAGLSYAVAENGYVKFGDVSRNLMDMQAQYGSRYLHGVEGKPNLAVGLRVEGDPDDYHTVSMHPEDIDEMVARFRAYRALVTGRIEDSEGAPRVVTQYERQEFQIFLRDSGIVIDLDS
jgi:hypothetical protein